MVDAEPWRQKVRQLVVHEPFQDFAPNGQEHNLAAVTRCSLSPFLNTGTTRAVFHDIGNIEVLKLRLNNEDRLSEIPSAQRHRRRNGILFKLEASSTFYEDSTL